MSPWFKKRSKPKKDSRIGLALGGGSARGWAHIGVLEALADLDVRIDCIAGTSIGSMVGGAYAAGKLQHLKNIALQLEWKHLLAFLDVLPPGPGLINGQKLVKELHSQFGDMNIEDLPIQYRAVATDLHSGREVVMDSGSLISAVRASISIPGVFTPVKRDDRYLVDGGLVNPTPVSVARAMGADFVIAVDINHYIVPETIIRKNRDLPMVRELNEKSIQFTQAMTSSGGILAKFQKKLEMNLPGMKKIHGWLNGNRAPNIIEVLMATSAIAEVQIGDMRLEIDRPDVLIRPHLGHIKAHEFDRAGEAIGEGYRQTMISLKDRVIGGRLKNLCRGCDPATGS